MRTFSSMIIQTLICVSLYAQENHLNPNSGESRFPGTTEDWKRYVSSHLVYPDEAEKQQIEGTVIVQFIVEKDGRLSHIEAVSGPAILRDAAVAVFKTSPDWISEERHGKKVRSYKKQPIVFSLK